MKTGIYNLLNDDKELMDLYNTDATFKKSIQAGYQSEMSSDKILIFALKNGYKEKQDIFNKYVEYKTYESKSMTIENNK